MSRRAGGAGKRRSPQTRIIETQADLADGVAALRRCCPVMRRVSTVTGLPPLRRFQPDLEGLARIIVGQQLSAASAAAIWTRTRALIDPFDPEGLLGLDEPRLRQAGLSAGKIRTLRETASALVERRVVLADLSTASDEAVRSGLTQIRGVGPWTADIYLLFCLGRADAWAPGDLALQLAAQHLMELDSKPSADALEKLAERWRPWRGVAARLLWAYYGQQRAAAKSVTGKAAG